MVAHVIFTSRLEGGISVSMAGAASILRSRPANAMGFMPVLPSSSACHTDSRPSPKAVSHAIPVTATREPDDIVIMVSRTCDQKQRLNGPVLLTLNVENTHVCFYVRAGS